MRHTAFTLSFAFSIFLVVSAHSAEKPGEWTDWTSDPTCAMVFHAVLEGLYTDGVSNEDVDRIIARDEKHPDGNMYEHFVYACPLCHPTYQALLLYRSRPDVFYGIKGEKNTFGKGLDPKISARLASKDKSERLAAIQELVQTWVNRKLTSMRLTEAEKSEMSMLLEARKKQGLKVLLQFQMGEHGAPMYKDWKSCAICAGSADGLKMPVPK